MLVFGRRRSLFCHVTAWVETPRQWDGRWCDDALLTYSIWFVRSSGRKGTTRVPVLDHPGSVFLESLNLIMAQESQSLSALVERLGNRERRFTLIALFERGEPREVGREEQSVKCGTGRVIVFVGEISCERG